MACITIVDAGLERAAHVAHSLSLSLRHGYRAGSSYSRSMVSKCLSVSLTSGGLRQQPWPAPRRSIGDGGAS